MNEKVCIIVPVYNVDKYLSRCIDSIMNQDYKNIEIICIDDGSTDNSGKICDEYALRDSRIRVIHQQNSGLSEARNAGLKACTSDFVTFVDSDDFISSDYVSTLYNLLIDNNSDISIGLLKWVYSNGKMKSFYSHFPRKVVTNSNVYFLEKMLYQKDFDTTAPGKMFRKKLFDNVKFPKGKLYEDIATIYKTFLLANNISFINKELYLYYQSDSSIVRSPFKEKDMDLIDATDKMFDDICTLGKHKIIKQSLINSAKCRCFSANCYILRRIGKNKGFELMKKRCYNNIKKYRKFDLKARLKNNIAVFCSYFI